MSQEERYVQEPIIKEDVEIAYDAQEERRGKYLKRLAQYLKDPEFRKIEGFPIGTDEAILALSDPPYYTACPNPFLKEILAEWVDERRQIREELGLPDEKNTPYRRSPLLRMCLRGKMTRYTMLILIIRRFHIKRSCATFCTTRILEILCLTVSAARG